MLDWIDKHVNPGPWWIFALYLAILDTVLLVTG